MLRMVPLPIRLADGEDEISVDELRYISPASGLDGSA
jgi:hypothetical protein